MRLDDGSRNQVREEGDEAVDIACVLQERHGNVFLPVEILLSEYVNDKTDSLKREERMPIGRGIMSRKAPTEFVVLKKVLEKRGLYLKKARIASSNEMPATAMAFLFVGGPWAM